MAAVAARGLSGATCATMRARRAGGVADNPPSYPSPPLVEIKRQICRLPRRDHHANEIQREQMGEGGMKGGAYAPLLFRLLPRP
jgi:hypothetical protein